MADSASKTSKGAAAGRKAAAATARTTPARQEDDRSAFVAAGFLGAVYRRATSGGRAPEHWVDTEGVSPLRDQAVGAVHHEMTGIRLSAHEARRLYVALTSTFLERVRPAAVQYVTALLNRQEPLVRGLVQVVDTDSERLRRAACAAVRYSMSQRIDSASGRVAHPDEAAALSGSGGSAGGNAVDRFERVRYTRAVLIGGDPDLRRLMAHPSGVAILKAYTRSTAEGRAHALARLQQSLEAIPAVIGHIEADPLAIWRLPPAIASGVAQSGLAVHPGAVEFALAWAVLKGRSFMDRALETAANAVCVLDLAGPVGRLIGAALDIVLGVVGTAVSFLREVEQDQAGYASAFAPDDGKLSAGGSYLDVAFQGVATLAAAAALPGAIAALGRRGGAATRAVAAVPEPTSPRGMVDGRSLPKDVVALDAVGSTERHLSADARALDTVRTQPGLSEAQHATTRPKTGAVAGTGSPATPFRRAVLKPDVLPHYSSKPSFMEATRKQILAQRDSGKPSVLDFLLTDEGKWQSADFVSKSGRSMRGRYALANPDLPIVQAGHSQSNWYARDAGKRQYLMLEDADLNWLTGQSGEARGAIFNKPAVLIEGRYAVDVPTARAWEGMRWIPRGTVDSAPLILPPEL
ncbi:polymorphic toxin type 5 domain-containing protein [Streptomyces sp. NPDC002755]|uniref:polymorphic toxin type 5 domain-containing protein n=1 Tax=Streptomyces sp. NPDC002884 TaxID=3154544 RepID=UPI003326ADC2